MNERARIALKILLVMISNGGKKSEKVDAAYEYADLLLEKQDKENK